MGVIVISVGTSLLTNNKVEIADHYNTLNREFHEKGVDINEIKGLSFEFDAGEKLIGLRPNNVDGLLEFSKSFFEKYLDEDSIKENISFRTQSCSDRLPAEISSLYLYYYHPDGGPREDTKGGDRYCCSPRTRRMRFIAQRCLRRRSKDFVFSDHDAR